MRSRTLFVLEALGLQLRRVNWVTGLHINEGLNGKKEVDKAMMFIAGEGASLRTLLSPATTTTPT